MVRSYLRHGETSCLGVICSPSPRSIFDGSRALVSALEDVSIWDVKRGEILSDWHVTGLKKAVTCLAAGPLKKASQVGSSKTLDDRLVAAGYTDGSIRIWSTATNAVTVTLDGHRKPITALAFDPSGNRLASGSQDTDIILWDLIAETGLFRLRGHRAQITALSFLTSKTDQSNHLVSVSKDTLLKLWYLPTQHCLDTTIAHRNECWSLAVLDIEAGEAHEDSAIVMTGGGEGELKLWRLDLRALDQAPLATSTSTPLRAIHHLTSTALLSLTSTSHTHRVPLILTHPTLPLVAVQTTDRNVDICRIRTDTEIRKKQARRRKREREKASKQGQAVPVEVEAEEPEVEWRDRIGSWQLITTTNGKISSFAWAEGSTKRAGPKGKGKSDGPEILITLNNNSFEVFTLPEVPEAGKKAESGPSSPEPVRSHYIGLSGHRHDIRALAVSSDDALIASASQGEVKVWNRKTGRCLRTMADAGYALCCQWLPGDKHLVVGTKAGTIELYDVAASARLETFDAHTGPLWSLHVRPDGRALVTGSADKDVKFWDFQVHEVVNTEGSAEATVKTLTLVHTRTLKMSDDVLAVKSSPDGRLLAVALLDSTVKVFYYDTLKFNLSLYGHKLPVLSLDISHDSKLIITCSADKNVKIWGLDFGDCHRSLFAHDDTIMQVAFEADSHYFWTVGKDRLVKYWDGDKFQQIQKFDGHHSEVWALAVSPRGKFAVSGGADKSIRIWEKTDEPLFLEEERERELEALYDANLPSSVDPFQPQPPGKEDDPNAIEETGGVTKQTTVTLTAGERIIDAVDLAEADINADEGTPRHPTLAYSGESAQAFVLTVVRGIPAAALEDALLVLPFNKAMSLIGFVDFWVRHRWQIPLSTRILYFLLRTHHAQITATRAMRDTLISLREHLDGALTEYKSTIGYNLAALRFLKRQQDGQKVADFYERRPENLMLDEATVRAKINEKGAKRKRAVQ